MTNAAADPVVNRVDARSGSDHLLQVAEGQRQHRANGRAQPPDAGGKAAAEGAMVTHAGGDCGMRQLEQDGTAPAGNDDHLAIDLPRDALGSGPYIIRLQQARAYIKTMALE